MAYINYLKIYILYTDIDIDMYLFKKLLKEKESRKREVIKRKE